MSNVDHPAHYGGEDDMYEVIKVLRAWDLEGARGFCWGNVIKYEARAHKKGHAVEDVMKAEWYATELVSIEAELAGQKMKPEPVPSSGFRYQVVTFRIPELGDDSTTFSNRCLIADMEWTLEKFGEIAAEYFKLKEHGGYGLAVGTSPVHVIYTGESTVGWLLRMFPSDEYTYYLRAIDR